MLSFRPFIVFWEVTRACMLACKHCRAKAQTKPHPDELKTEEGYRLIDQLAEFGKPYPLLIITGGDPLMRKDLKELLEYATGKGFRVAIAFSGTKLATEEKIGMLADAGVSRIAISLDGSNPEVHDHFRGKTGTFEISLRIIDMAKEFGIPVQINTTVTNHNIFDLPNVMKICVEKEVTLWDVFFLVPTGRAKPDMMPSSQDFEDILNWLYDVSKETPLNVKSSAACHLRRIEYMRDRGIYDLKLGETYRRLREDLLRIKREMGLSGEDKEIVAGAKGRSLADGIRRMTGITDGRGMLFVSHTGDVYPSGFLPIVAGNVRRESVKEIYMNSKVFVDLKDPNRLKGKCGVCEYRYICGGSRARAYAMTGDYLAQEPRCVYIPRGGEPIVPKGV